MLGRRAGVWTRLILHLVCGSHREYRSFQGAFDRTTIMVSREAITMREDRRSERHRSTFLRSSTVVLASVAGPVYVSSSEARTIF